MMWKHLLFMVLILGSLVLWDRTLSQRTEQSRAESVRIERLLDTNAVFTPDRPVAAFRVDRGDGTVHAYVRQEGLWRCLSAYGAVASNDHIGALLPKLDEARGVIQTRQPKAATEYGFDTQDMLTLAVCGPDMLDDPAGDVIYALDIGKSIPSTGGSYVRPVGTNEVWAVNVDFRDVLAGQENQMIPPMLDPHVVPAAWPGLQSPGVDRIVVELPDQPPLELQRVELDDQEQLAAEDQPNWYWTVKRGDRIYEGDAFQIFSFGGFLLRAPYAGILAPRDPKELGLDQPRGRITLRGSNNLHLQLIIGGQTQRGGIALYNTFTRNVYEMPPELLELLLPDMDLLLFDHLGNPWEPYIRPPTREIGR